MHADAHARMHARMHARAHTHLHTQTKTQRHKDTKTQRHTQKCMHARARRGVRIMRIDFCCQRGAPASGGSAPHRIFACLIITRQESPPTRRHTMQHNDRTQKPHTTSQTTPPHTQHYTTHDAHTAAAAVAGEGVENEERERERERG